MTGGDAAAARGRARALAWEVGQASSRGDLGPHSPYARTHAPRALPARPAVVGVDSTPEDLWGTGAPNGGRHVAPDRRGVKNGPAGGSAGGVTRGLTDASSARSAEGKSGPAALRPSPRVRYARIAGSPSRNSGAWSWARVLTCLRKDGVRGKTTRSRAGSPTSAATTAGPRGATASAAGVGGCYATTARRTTTGGTRTR